jgi:copper chaperone
MFTFQVDDMTCGHCVASITRAVQAADPGAQLRIDLPTHRVAVEPATADAQTLMDAMTEAGYTPRVVDAA